VTALAAGASVPAFSLARADGSPFTREDLIGHTTVLVFYPFAFSPVCTDQLSVYDGESFGDGVAVYGVSCDSTWAQSAFIEKLGVTRIPQLSDFEPKGAATRAFGVLHPGGFPQRALFVIGPEATVRWSYVADSPGELPPAQLIHDALAG
jgi:peroxiredoxin (alkyl hydroperoxide reductase subunit C)